MCTSGGGEGPGSDPDRRVSDVYEVSDAEFEDEVLKADLPVLVDFWAPWCGPCRRISPIVEELASELGGKLKVVKVNTDDNSDSPGKFGVMSIPTLILFKEGEEADRVVGAGISKSE